VDVTEREGRRARILISRDEIVLMEFEMDPETDGAGPHYHRTHVDSFYVLEGKLEVTVAGDVVEAGPGTLVHAAPEVVHSFRNLDLPTRLLNFHTPGARFDEYMKRMDAGEDPDPEEYDVFEVEG
jgi:quercetin dioxygenase-like cupin family protein